MGRQTDFAIERSKVKEYSVVSDLGLHCLSMILFCGTLSIIG